MILISYSFQSYIRRAEAHVSYLALPARLRSVLTVSSALRIRISIYIRIFRDVRTHFADLFISGIYIQKWYLIS